MDIFVLVSAALMGIVEGLTEFLPISSTGHLILAAHVLSFEGSYVHVFEIVIQAGAILALCWEFRARLISKIHIQNAPVRLWWSTLILAFLPAAILGLLFGETIKSYLFQPVPVALAFILGGVAIIWVERRTLKINLPATLNPVVTPITPSITPSIMPPQITPTLALKIGVLQALALIPGTSRSGASIIGAMWLGVPRAVATEFSFFLAIPTLFGATIYSLYKARTLLNINDAPVFAIGLLTSFISAFICVRWLLRYVSSHTFIPFAWYRIIFGIVILALYGSGFVHWSRY